MSKKFENNKKKENKFTKDQIINSKKYVENKDLLNAILDNKEYTLKEIDEIINNFLKGKVN